MSFYRSARALAASASLSLILSACGSAYSATTSSVNKLGAAEYMPAVDVAASGKSESQYQTDLSACRAIAANRQATASQEAQQETLSNAVATTTGGALAGAAIGAALTDEDGESSRVGNAAKGGAIGALGGLFASSAFTFAEQSKEVSSQTKKILLRCLEGRGYNVLEDA